MKHLSLLLFALFATTVSHAQETGTTSINLYGGYNFSDQVNFDVAYGYVEEAFQYGGGIEYCYYHNNSVELKYLRTDTHMPLYGPRGEKLNSGDDKGAINYILIGGKSYFGDSSQTVLPYLGYGLGVGIVETPQNGNSTGFAWDLSLGMKIKTESLVSINLQAYLQSVTEAVGSSYYYTYYGIYPVTEYVATYQFGLCAVLCFDFE
jgi:hypothetical protein